MAQQIEVSLSWMVYALKIVDLPYGMIKKPESRLWSVRGGGGPPIPLIFFCSKIGLKTVFRQKMLFLAENFRILSTIGFFNPSLSGYHVSKLPDQ